LVHFPFFSLFFVGGFYLRTYLTKLKYNGIKQLIGIKFKVISFFSKIYLLLIFFVSFTSVLMFLLIWHVQK